jgi:hypothetical protein
MSEWISVKEKLPPTPHQMETWDDDEKVERRYSNSQVHRVIWWNRAKQKWVSKHAVYTDAPLWPGESGWSLSGSLQTVTPDFWLPIPLFPDPPKEQP